MVLTWTPDNGAVIHVRGVNALAVNEFIRRKMVRQRPKVGIQN